jgi:uncharacterized membrane protein HdeD (DUF308 family)
LEIQNFHVILADSRTICHNAKLAGMKFFFKNSGMLLLLIGILFLIVPFFLQLQTNTSLSTGWVMIVAGFILFIFLNKKIP